MPLWAHATHACCTLQSRHLGARPLGDNAHEYGYARHNSFIYGYSTFDLADQGYAYTPEPGLRLGLGLGLGSGLTLGLGLALGLGLRSGLGVGLGLAMG